MSTVAKTGGINLGMPVLALISRIVRPPCRSNRNSKLLETPLTRTKQSIGPRSNRYKNAPQSNSRSAPLEWNT